MKYLSVCSGIEAASVAWEPLGWTPMAFSEIEPFPSAVLAHHWPEVPNLGDMTKYHEWKLTTQPDLIVGGTPCQAFSVAGLRRGLADPRGNLTLTFLAILERVCPRWVVWENVPGVLSDQTGAFGAFLGGLGELGYGFAYRVLDAQHFGVPQRRRRVFVVGCLGDWRPAAAVLFEPQSLRGDSEKGQYAWEENATRAGNGIAKCITTREGNRQDLETTNMVTVGALCANGKAAGSATNQDAENGLLIAHTLRGEGFDASEDGSGRGTPLVPCHTIGAGFCQQGFGTLRGREQDSHENLIAFQQNQSGEVREGNIAGTLNTNSNPSGRNTPMVAYRTSGNCGAWPTGDRTDALTTASDPFSHVMASRLAVRRLTPVECERLQGFPDNHTRIQWRGKPEELCPDGPRYKAIGNSMAVPVMRWIGRRIQSLL